MRKSLNFKINILMVIVVALLFFIVGSLDYRQKRAQRTEELHADLVLITQRLSHTLKMPTWNMNLVTMTNGIIAEMQNKHIQTIAVYDAITHAIVFGKTRDDDWKVVDLHDPVSDAPMQKTGNVIYLDKTFAYITVQMTDTFVREELMSMAMTQAQTMILLTLTFIIALTTTIFFAVVKPIKELTHSVRAMTDGHVNEPIDVSRDDELGELAKDFTLMRDTVHQKIERLNQEIVDRKAIEHELKASEENLRKSERRFREVITQAADAIFIHNMQGELLEVNQRACESLGYSRRELLTMGVMDVEIDFPDLEHIQPVWESLTPQHGLTIEGQQKRKDSTTFPIEARLGVLSTEGEKQIIAIARDITERKRTQEMLIQSEKMLSVGGLAAGMAHEINNPLGGMMQTADVMSRRLTNVEMPANQRAAEEAGTSIEAIHAFMESRGIIRMLGNIRESGRRAAEIVQNMLSFARKSDSTFSTHNLADLLDQTVNLAGSDYDLKKKFDFRQIEILREYEADLPDVPCEPGKIQQVFLNILRNGAEAMQEDNEEFAMNNEELQKSHFILRLLHEKNQNMLRIEIEDNGPGMDEATRKRAFEPFFTTKPVGVGTGLGLSVSYFIITENHGGEMRVESAPGVGTTFIIRLPIERRSHED